MIKGVIIEDQSVHREYLRKNLTAFCPEVQVIAELKSGAEALEKLPSLQFDILFLDIELGDMNSFELLQKMQHKDFHIIFITSFDKYAMQAFKVHAIDYLLKPVEGPDLNKAINRAMTQIFNEERRYGVISEYSMQKNSRLLISETNEFKLIDFKNIIYCKADVNYTDVIHFDGKGNLTKSTDTHNLKFYEEKLRSYGFVRIHQSFLVNKEHVTRIKKNPCEIVLSTSLVLPVARERKQDVLDFLSS
jgi:two-component system, LytTR family, response regulator